jgi:hypothetical protein
MGAGEALLHDLSVCQHVVHTGWMQTFLALGFDLLVQLFHGHIFETRL